MVSYSHQSDAALGRTLGLPQTFLAAGANSARSAVLAAGDALLMTGPVRLRPVVAATGGAFFVRIPDPDGPGGSPV